MFPYKRCSWSESNRTLSPAVWNSSKTENVINVFVAKVSVSPVCFITVKLSVYCPKLKTSVYYVLCVLNYIVLKQTNGTASRQKLSSFFIYSKKLYHMKNKQYL